MELTVVVHEEQPVAVHEKHRGYWSEVRELTGCFASARTLEELSEALAEAVEFCLEDGAVELEPAPLQVGEQRLRARPRRRKGRPG